MISFLIGLIILSIPLILGPLRKGIKNILLSILGLYGYFSFVISLYNELYGDTYGRFASPFGLDIVPNLDAPLRLDIIMSVIIFGSMLITLLCFFWENNYHEGKKETFYDEKLFYRYGQRVKSDIIPIGIKQIKKSTEELARNLYYQLSKNMKHRFGVNKQFSTELISVLDSHLRDDVRLFIKLKFITIRGSQLYYFVNLRNVGNQIAVSSLAYIKSNYHWHHVFRYVVSAPLHYWLWIYHWMMKKHSLQSRLGNVDVDNTFEKLDLEAYLKSATFTIMSSIEDFAKENNLFTEELKQLIIHNIHNTQNINIRKSQGIRIGRLKINSNPFKT